MQRLKFFFLLLTITTFLNNSYYTQFLSWNNGQFKQINLNMNLGKRIWDEGGQFRFEEDTIIFLDNGKTEVILNDINGRNMQIKLEDSASYWRYNSDAPNTWNYMYPGKWTVKPVDIVTIGTQVWMRKNLDVSTFRNGDVIPQASTDAAWKAAGENKQPAWCYYDNDTANGAKYGKLYNWYAVNDPRGLAPAGYHIPTDAEWTVLTDYLGGEDVAGKKMKSASGWFENGNGTNSSGFSGLPGGFRINFGAFFNIGSNGYWWSSTKRRTIHAWLRHLYSSSGNVERGNWGHWGKKAGFSVRCLRD